jgi:hypothetical protein
MCISEGRECCAQSEFVGPTASGSFGASTITIILNESENNIFTIIF